MNILEILQDDYQRFPINQTYNIYDTNVYFKDPLNEFQGRERYKKMINFMSAWFKDIKMDLHNIHQKEDIIYTEWTLNWTTPLPWQPRIAIPGRTELTLNKNNLIVSHVDYWNCSRWDVVKQHLWGFSGNR